MPFGKYKDWQACLDDNADKSNAEAFCAWLHHEVTGQWPGEMARDMPEPCRAIFIDAFGAAMKSGLGEATSLIAAQAILRQAGWNQWNGQWVRISENVKMHRISGVTIFSAGTHNDETYNVQDLDSMIQAFHALKGRLDPPLKLGHTSDEFNQSLAAKMGVLPELIAGEDGKGAIALGWVEDIWRESNVLKADLMHVPEPLKEIIQNKSYHSLSAEILFNYQDDGETYPRVLSGLALLGAELPAVPEVDLEGAAIYTSGHKPDRVVETAAGGKDVNMAARIFQKVKQILFRRPASEVTREMVSCDLDIASQDHAGDVDALVGSFGEWAGGTFTGCVGALEGKPGITNVEALCAWLHHEATGTWPSEKEQKDGGNEIMTKEVCIALGLAEDANDEQVLEAVQKLQAAAKLSDIFEALGLKSDATMAEAVEAIKGLKAPKTETKEYTDLQAKFQSATAENTQLKRTGKKSEFTEKARAWQAVSGKPDEIAERLMKLYDANPELATERIAEYEQENQRLVSAGITKPIGTPREGTPDETHPFDKTIAELCEKDVKLTRAQAFKLAREANPAQWRDYMKQRPAAIKGEVE